jgi:hypothetical protein
VPSFCCSLFLQEVWHSCIPTVHSYPRRAAPDAEVAEGIIAALVDAREAQVGQAVALRWLSSTARALGEFRDCEGRFRRLHMRLSASPLICEWFRNLWLSWKFCPISPDSFRRIAQRRETPPCSAAVLG